MHTRLHRITDLEKDQKLIQESANFLKQGQCVVFPTETVYGLGSNALDKKAVEKVYEIKNRPHDNPLIVHVASKEALEACAEQLSPEAHKLIDAFCPGPLSVLVQKKKDFPDYATAGSDKICLRIPSHPVAQALLKAANLPIAAPSANLSTRPSPTRGAHAASSSSARRRPGRSAATTSAASARAPSATPKRCAPPGR